MQGPTSSNYGKRFRCLSRFSSGEENASLDCSHMYRHRLFLLTTRVSSPYTVCTASWSERLLEKKRLLPFSGFPDHCSRWYHTRCICLVWRWYCFSSLSSVTWASSFLFPCCPSYFWWVGGFRSALGVWLRNRLYVFRIHTRWWGTLKGARCGRPSVSVTGC